MIRDFRGKLAHSKAYICIFAFGKHIYKATQYLSICAFLAVDVPNLKHTIHRAVVQCFVSFLLFTTQSVFQFLVEIF